ncbi:MAG: hypothetical protein P1U89_11670 [Verrucomicrobiales bacterium]|nr:hypothetical protein [Verrucomicrobiales bacterium]
MNFLTHPVIILTLLTVSFSTGKSHAQTPERIDLTAFPGEIVKDVVIPIPAEIFAVLDKVGEPDWENAIIHVKTDMGVKDRGFLAMSFGSLVAEGFIAVQAESSDDIQKIGRRSLEFAEALGLENAVKQHSLTVIDSAKDNQWNRVRAELDKTQQTVRNTMDQQRDQEISGLVSLGGWLRGTNVLTGLIADDYTVDKAELLNQPDLVLHFRELIAGITGPIRTTREMVEIETGLGRIDAMMRENERFSVDVVKKLHRITTGMLEQFYFDAGAEKE